MRAHGLGELIGSTFRRCLFGLLGSVVAVGAYYFGALSASAFPPSCRLFLDPPLIACSGCVDVFNCGNCSGGNCNAITYQVCTKTYATLARPTGKYEDVQHDQPCYRIYLCGIPNPCSGPCTASGVQVSQSEETTTISVSGGNCP